MTKTLVDMFSAEAHRHDDDQRASYGIALLTAKGGKAHTIGDVINAPVNRSKEYCSEERSKNSFESYFFDQYYCTGVVCSRRIDVMAGDTERNLCNILQNMEFSLQLIE